MPLWELSVVEQREAFVKLALASKREPKRVVPGLRDQPQDGLQMA